MAKKAWLDSPHVEAKPKLTSIGNGRRKRGSYKVKRKKPYRGQGK
tara:strand:+ start:750 stop:884 length:135 start_codon:yes stop_codon:yes gene_type:complete